MEKLVLAGANALGRSPHRGLAVVRTRSNIPLLAKHYPAFFTEHHIDAVVCLEA